MDPTMLEASAASVGNTPDTNSLPVRRLPIRLEGDDRRVILRPFVLSNGRVRTLFDRLEGMSEADVATLLSEVESSFGERHAKLRSAFDEHFILGADLIGWKGSWSKTRQTLAGAYLTMEYAVDSAALFNP